MTWTSAQKRSVSVTVASSGVMSGICACWRSVSVIVASLGVFFRSVSVHSFWAATYVHTMRIPFFVGALPSWSAPWRCRSWRRILGALSRSSRLDWRRCLPVPQKLKQALMMYQSCRPGCDEIPRKNIRPSPLGVG